MLGALMIDKDAYAVVCETLRPESFYEPRNQMVYAAIRDLSMEEKPVDVLTVTDQLSKTGKLDEVGGPVAIVHSIWFSVLASFAGALAFIRFLNVNLAILNLLPIPVLDGGHIVFALWRGVTGREIPPRVLNGLVNAFMVLLMALFAWLCLHDVWQLYVR